MATWVVFGLLVGWLGGYVALRRAVGVVLKGLEARRLPDVKRLVMIAVPRLVSWGCGLALAMWGLWCVARAVTR